MATATVGTFEWKASYSIGIEEMDNQHKKLVSLVNDLHLAMLQGKGRAAAGRILDDLIAYTRFHFETEESFLESHGYPNVDQHRGKHATLTQMVRGFRNDLNAGDLALSTKLMSFLTDWLMKHILGTDKEYARYLQAKGVH